MSFIRWVAHALGLSSEPQTLPVKRPRDPEPDLLTPPPPKRPFKQVPLEIREAFPFQTHRRDGKLVFSGVTKAKNSGQYIARISHPITYQQVVVGRFSDKSMAALCVAMAATARSEGEVQAVSQALRACCTDWDWATDLRDRALSGAPTPEASE